MFSAPKSLDQRLAAILATYQAIADSDPVKLRLLLEPTEIWRFFVDGQRQIQKGWISFEKKEPGYLRAMMQTWQQMFDFSSELTVDKIFAWHKMVGMDVENTNYTSAFAKANNFVSTGGAVRDDKWGGYYLHKHVTTLEGMVELLSTTDSEVEIPFFISVKFLTKAGINNASTYTTLPINREFIQHLQSLPPALFESDILSHDTLKSCEDWISPNLIEQYFALTRNTRRIISSILKGLAQAKTDTEAATALFSLINNHADYSKKFIFLYSSCAQAGPEMLAPVLDFYLRVHQRLLMRATTAKEKLQIIAALNIHTERGHVFYDLNTRLFSMVVENHILMRHGFPFAMLENPNRAGCRSEQEWYEDIIYGMEQTLALASNAYQRIYSVRTDEILHRQLTDEQRDYFESVTDIEREARTSLSIRNALRPPG